MTSHDETQRHMGLAGATGVGVGAIVGGGILALAGVAFAVTGPAAILAFTINGVVALLTALSFGEMASKFPQSGGTYTFAKKVLSVEAAFTVGWVVWFASMVAAVLYAIGFAYFATLLVADLLQGWEAVPIEWITDERVVTVTALVTIGLLSVDLVRRSGGGAAWVNLGKMAVFGVLILGGLWALGRQSPTVSAAKLQPFFSSGWSGLIQAMGYTFIALQGFDLIAAVAGEVRRPAQTIPRAMVLSLAIALGVYIPLLLVIATVGTPLAEPIDEAARQSPEDIVALAAQNYLGAFGYWLVIVAAVLSMFSALQANLFAASRIARAMARDSTLPAPLSKLHPKYGTPAIAVIVTGLIVALLVLALPEVRTAGAASSLIFLITFTLAHGISVLVRRRSANRPPPFRAPLFPLVPIVGGLACVSLAVFQGIMVPAAGLIVMVWLGLGGLLFVGLLARRARVLDATSTALEPELLTLRGHTPLVLVPIANPENAPAMLALAEALVPAEIGRVLIQTVVVAPPDWNPDRDPAPMERTQRAWSELLRAAARLGIRAEALTTIAPEPMREIERVARLHRCHSVLLGLSEIEDRQQGVSLETLLGELDVDVVVLRARRDWQLDQARRILVPVAGRGGHEHLLALLLGSLVRTGDREVNLLRVVPPGAAADEVRRARQELAYLVNEKVRKFCQIDVARHEDPTEEVARRAEQSDLLILGVRRLGRHKKLFGDFTRRIARRTDCPIVVISRRG